MNVCSKGFADIAQLLVEKGSNLEEANNQGVCAQFFLSSLSSLDSVLNFVVPQETAFDVAASAEKMEICTYLIHTFDIQKNSRGQDGKPPPKILARTTGIELLYENQRAGLVGEYSRAGLLRTDLRGAFSNITHQPVNFNDIKLPDRNWFWLSDWAIDKTGNVDEAGWEVRDIGERPPLFFF